MGEEEQQLIHGRQMWAGGMYVVSGQSGAQHYLKFAIPWRDTGQHWDSLRTRVKLIYISLKVLLLQSFEPNISI